VLLDDVGPDPEHREIDLVRLDEALIKLAKAGSSAVRDRGAAFLRRTINRRDRRSNWCFAGNGET
jgi:hypothetical protein